nr:unnamed protein product [Spirometra erinaceieuropaei]
MPRIEAFAKEVAPLPLLSVLALTAIKDAYEDLRRYRSDQKVNNTLTEVFSLDERRYVKRPWASIRPGDFVRLQTNEIIPADILILKSSDISGLCHIETANLDGENNLKQREIVRADCFKVFSPEEFCWGVEVEAPNPELYHFSGQILAPKPIIVRKENLLLRGCILRNTDSVEGMVIYAGRETKAVLNNSGRKFKRSKLERRINKDIIWCVLILAIVCITGAVGCYIWLQSFPSYEIPFLAGHKSEDSSVEAFTNFWTCIIIFQNIIPLPLYVTIEFVKLFQVWFIANDIELYDEEKNKRVEVRAFNIPEDLGQIEYVFCDKTGTLTENKMEFRRAAINGVDYWADAAVPSENSVSEVDVACDNFEYSRLSSVQNVLSTFGSHQNSRSTSFQRTLCNLASTSYAEGDADQNRVYGSRNNLLPNRRAPACAGLPRYLTRKCSQKPSPSPPSPSRSPSPSSSNQTLQAEAPDLEAEQCQRIQDFFLCLAICNTVVVSVNKNVPAPLAPAPRTHLFHIRRNRAGSKGQIAPEDSSFTRSSRFHISRSSKALSDSRTASQSKFRRISASLGNLLTRAKRSRRRISNYSSQDDTAVATAAMENKIVDQDADSTYAPFDREEPVVFTLPNNVDFDECAGSSVVAGFAADRGHQPTSIIEGCSNSHCQARAASGYSCLANSRPLSVVAESSQASQATDSRRQSCITGGIPHLDPSLTAISSVPRRVTPLTDSGMQGPPADRFPSSTPGDAAALESSGSSLFSLAGTVPPSVRRPQGVPRLKLSPASAVASADSSARRLEDRTPSLSGEEGETAANGACRSVDSLDVLKSARTDISLDGSNGSLNERAKGVCPISEATLLNGYESESPDEIALTKTACIYGCKLLQRGLDFVVLWLPGEGMIRVQVLHVLPFDSTRKCMSIIVRHPATNEIVLYTKGADSVLMEKLAPAQDNSLCEATKNHLTNYAHAGLRTLVLAKRVISEREYAVWSAAYLEAETSYTEAEERKAQLTQEIENNFELLGKKAAVAYRFSNYWVKSECIAYILTLSPPGVTGIEDRLQEGVPETLSDLRRAGMKVWVLTGDKPETATSIAYASKLFAEGQRLLKITANNAEEAEAAIKRHIADLVSGGLSEELTFPGPLSMNGQYLQTSVSLDKKGGLTASQPSEYFDTSFSVVSLLNNEVPVNIPQNLSMVVDGHTLNFLLEPEVWPLFMSLAQLCSSVVCCRVSPHQKAAVVSAVKSELGVQTLAIGDGANDVNMIQCADVGIGISGQEGMQAVMASDFAISRFRFLKRLLLVHGHCCYEKLARMTLYMFYKDALYILSLFWYQFFNGFSGSAHIDQLSQILFMVAMTSIPPFILGIFDKPLDQSTLMANPELYRNGRDSMTYKHWHFWMNTADAVWQSLVIFFTAAAVYADSNVAIWQLGMVCMNCMVFVSILHIGIESKCWTMLHFLTYGGSYLVFWLLFTMIYNSIGVTKLGPDPPYFVIFVSMMDVKFWLCMLIITPVALLPRLLMNSLTSTFSPSLDTAAALLERKFGTGKRLPLQDYLGDYDNRDFSNVIYSEPLSTPVPRSSDSESVTLQSSSGSLSQPPKRTQDARAAAVAASTDLEAARVDGTAVTTVDPLHVRDVRHRIAGWFTTAGQLLQRMPLLRSTIDEPTAAIRTVSIVGARPSSAPGQCDAHVVVRTPLHRPTASAGRPGQGRRAHTLGAPSEAMPTGGSRRPPFYTQRSCPAGTYRFGFPGQFGHYMTRTSADCGPYGDGEQASGQLYAAANSDYIRSPSFDSVRQIPPAYDERWLTVDVPHTSEVQPSGLGAQPAPYEDTFPSITIPPPETPYSARRRTVFVVLPPLAQDHRRKPTN